MSDSDQSGMVQTVLGLVPPESLGPTTTHEHLLINFEVMFHAPSEASERYKAFQPVSMENLAWIGYDPFRNLDNCRLLDEDVAVSEALRYKMAGGGTMVDATTIGIGRDPLALARISRVTGLNLVMGAGYYVDAAHPEGMDDKTDSDIAEEMVADITAGVANTGVKAGIIGELGCSWPVTENERKVLRAGAQAQRETGAAILIHPGRNKTAPFEIIDVLAEAGADVSRVIISHLERTIASADAYIELAQTGCCLELDLFGWETSNYAYSEMDMISDAQRMDIIQRLIEEGFSSQIVIAHDICTKHRTTKYGGHGYSHILENIVPRMRSRGIDEADIQGMIVSTPARLLTLV